MGESRKRKERKREPIKQTDQLPPLPITTDRTLATKQRAYCKNVVVDMLDDQSSLSFSKPVRELWDIKVLTDYFEKIKSPMDLGTVRKTLLSNTSYINSETSLFDPNAFRFDVRLVFLNALLYNAKGTDLYRLATKFLNFIDSQLVNLPSHSPSEKNDTHSSEELQSKSDKSHKPPKSENFDKSEKKKPKSPSDDNSDYNSDQLQQDSPDTDHHSKQNSLDDEEADKLHRQISSLNKKKVQSEAALAELELKRNVPLTFEENSKLRDQVENLPWETAQKVVKILHKYVEEALKDTQEEDPEFVTLEFSTVEPPLLRDIEALIRPDPRVEKERKLIESIDDQISGVKRKLRSLPDHEQSSKKKPRRRR